MAEQSQEADIAKRKEIVWKIERILVEEWAADHLFTAGCDVLASSPQGTRPARELDYNNWRFDSVWLDR